jgi:hypothetical protein
MNQVCYHITDNEEGDVSFFRYFTGKGTEYYLICSECFNDIRNLNNNLREIPFEVFLKYDNYMFTCIGHQGQPQIKVRDTSLRFEHSVVKLKSEIGEHILDLQPVNSYSNCRLIALTESLRLILIDLDTYDFSEVCHISSDLNIDFSKEIFIKLSNKLDVCAIANKKGQFGSVISLNTGNILMKLDRGNYHSGVSIFPVAFFERKDKTLIIHGTDWNRLDISDPFTGEVLTNRESPKYQEIDGQLIRPHYLDYFHGEISISEDNQWIVDNGWVWHPVGQIFAWSINKWLDENVWESEDGQSKKELCNRIYYWEGKTCWIDNSRIAVYGFGDDDDWIIPAVRIFDVSTGQELMWFTGPDNNMVFDEYLFSLDLNNGVKVWDIDSGEMLLCDNSFCPKVYHKTSKCFISKVSDNEFKISKLIIDEKGEKSV